MPIDSHLPQADPFSLVPTFNDHMDKSEHIIGFYKIVWVPSNTRDQNNAKKHLKSANISHFEIKMFEL